MDNTVEINCTHFDLCKEEAFKQGCRHALDMLTGCIPQEHEKIDVRLIVKTIEELKEYLNE